MWTTNIFTDDMEANSRRLIWLRKGGHGHDSTGKLVETSPVVFYCLCVMRCGDFRCRLDACGQPGLVCVSPVYSASRRHGRGWVRLWRKAKAVGLAYASDCGGVSHRALMLCSSERAVASIGVLGALCLRLPARRPSAAGSAVLPACRTAGACGRVGVSSGALSFVCPRESAPVSGAICGIWRAFGPAAAGMRAADCVCDAPRLAPRVCGSAVLDMFVQFFQRAASVAVHQPGQLERGADASGAPRPCSTLHNVCSGLLEAASPGVSQGRCSVNSRAYMIEYG